MKKKNIFERYYNSDRATKTIYGAILIFAFLIGQYHNTNNSALPVVFGTFFAAVAIVLAEIYSEILGKTIKHKRKLSKNDRHELVNDSLAIISISFWPSGIFMLSYLGLYDTNTAFIISYALLISVLFISSYLANRLSNFSKYKSLLTAILVSFLGVIVVVVKYSLGH